MMKNAFKWGYPDRNTVNSINTSRTVVITYHLYVILYSLHFCDTLAEIITI